jgi:hypothetical protein
MVSRSLFRPLLWAGLILVAGNSIAAPTAGVSFYRQVRPILSNHCFQCHGPDAGTREADLRLDVAGALTAETSSGGRLIVPGDPEASELIARVTAHDAAEKMPPDEANKPLTDAQIETLRAWIAAGATWQEHWAYQPLQRPELPSGEAANPIDRFVLARLAAIELTPAAPADPITLARRVQFDLTGLPPDPAEVAAFAADPSDEAYARWLDRAFAAPHYGERMAVHWLDLVRYADSCGYHSDVEQPISPYRDYVIAAFQANLPFDQFTREQLAGDLLANPTLTQRVASGYNRLNKTTEEGGAQAGEYLVKSAADRVRTTAGVWLGATLGCAECHDHKYDPYTARDFYSFAAFFADIQEEGVCKANRRDPELRVPTPEQAEQLAALDKQLSELSSAGAGGDEALAVRIAELTKQREAVVEQGTRTMITVAAAPREMRILPRGNWLDQTGPIVEPALPTFLASASTSKRLTRLDLANWLVSRDNPLTARVVVNRYWKLLFGAGLVTTLDDFGTQGDAPEHQALLDWLACEFIDSGWNTQHILRLMLTSDTYRRSSVATPQQLERDPTNRNWARQNYWRLEAEFIRDAALATSGLLDRSIGGPSVKPYQPDGYWEFLNFPKRIWKASTGQNQYRRGLYTHWQRTFLHPSLLAFDAPSREECTAQRAVSNTPQAALALLNDPSYVEAAHAFAQCILREPSLPPDLMQADTARIDWAWHAALSRSSTPAESQVLVDLLAHHRAHYQQDAEAARKLLAVGQTASSSDNAAELAAWTSVARTLLNLREFVTRN